jgi:hypothetical protein
VFKEEVQKKIEKQQNDNKDEEKILLVDLERVAQPKKIYTTSTTSINLSYMCEM